MVFMGLSHILMFIIGDWNWILSGMAVNVKRRLNFLGSCLYIISGCFLIVVSDRVSQLVTLYPLGRKRLRYGMCVGGRLVIVLINRLLTGT